MFSPQISLSAYPLLKRIRFLDTIEDAFKKIYPDYFAFNYRKAKIDSSDKFFMEGKTQEIETLRSNKASRVSANNLEITLITLDSTKSTFYNIFVKSTAY